MRAAAWGFVWMAAVVLGGCATNGLRPDPARPLTVDDGGGSEFGNYPARVEEGAAGTTGTGCTVYAWDRPLSRDYLLRLTSQSCPSDEHPGRMASTELSRNVVPVSQSAPAAP